MRRGVKRALQDMDEFNQIAEEVDAHGGYSNKITLSLYIHAVTRGNDALCLHFFGEKCRRHQNAYKMFRTLYENNHIDEQYSRSTTQRKDLIDKKNDCDYKEISLGDNEFERYRKKATRFLTTVREIAGNHDIDA